MEKEKENNKLIIKKIFVNIIIAISIMLYFILINFSHQRMKEDFLIKGIKIASLIVLFISILIFEIAYNKDSGKLAINGIEVLVLSFHTLTIYYIVNRFNILFETYILFSTYIFAIYYILKSILIYTNKKENI